MSDTYDDPVNDPVCGREMTPRTAEATAEYDGHTYYFHSIACKETFITNPEKYVEEEREKSR